VPDDRETLHIESWSWTLEKLGQQIVLTVVCGSVGLYERTLVLTPEEAGMWEQGGAAALAPLVEAIRNDVTGAAFGSRYLTDDVDG
jgi:hypothetical protein